jgi:hypothetical protein
MNAREFYERALLTSLPVAAKITTPRNEKELARDNGAYERRVAHTAFRLAFELTEEWEHGLIAFSTTDQKNKDHPEYVPTTRDLVRGQGDAGKN